MFAASKNFDLISSYDASTENLIFFFSLEQISQKNEKRKYFGNIAFGTDNFHFKFFLVIFSFSEWFFSWQNQNVLEKIIRVL